jgi:hypothetical protein
MRRRGVVRLAERLAFENKLGLPLLCLQPADEFGLGARQRIACLRAGLRQLVAALFL